VESQKKIHLTTTFGYNFSLSRIPSIRYHSDEQRDFFELTPAFFLLNVLTVNIFMMWRGKTNAILRLKALCNIHPFYQSKNGTIKPHHAVSNVSMVYIPFFDKDGGIENFWLFT